MKEMLILSVLALLTSAVTGCGGGTGWSYPNMGDVSRCPEEYSPIEKDLNESDKLSKVSWPNSGSAAPELQEGEYEYAGMEFFFIDVTGYKFHMAEVESDGSFQIKRICGRNALDLKPMKLDFEFPSSVSIASAGKATSVTKVLTIQYTDRLSVSISDPTEETDPPSKVTGDQNFDSQLYERTSVNGQIVYEYRMEDVSGPVKKFALIKYRRAGSPP